MNISLLTVLVTLLLGILGFIVNTYLQRQNNSIDVITKNRIERRTKTQEIMATFIKYADYNSIKSVIALNKQNDAIQELYTNYATLRSLYTNTFKKDIELMNKCKDLLNTIVKYLNDFEKYSKEDIDKQLNIDKQNFEYIFDLYLYTDWSRIKAETIGKRKNGGAKKWLDDFDEAERLYEKTFQIMNNSFGQLYTR